MLAIYKGGSCNSDLVRPHMVEDRFDAGVMET